MLRPFLFVGVGGSGAKTIRALKQTLQHRLEQLHWDSGIPEAWQFVQVDSYSDGADFSAPFLPDADIINLFHPDKSHLDAVQRLERLFASKEDRIDALAGWCAAPPPIPINTHPGMRRNVWRTFAAAHLKEIQDRLRVKVSSLTNAHCQEELRAMSNSLGFASCEMEALPDPAVVTVSSLVGGTGSGVFIDVIEVLKSIDPSASWLQHQLAFLYTPEVFDGIPEGMRSQMPMNALGAMNEILAGLWANEQSRASQALFATSGLRVSREHRKGAFGPAGAYLIGAHNAKGVDLSRSTNGAGMNGAFTAVGEALAGLATHPEIDFTQCFYENVFPGSELATVASDKTGLRRSIYATERMPFAAFGAARLTLGMDYLLDYAADALTKDQIRTMLFPQFEPSYSLNPLSAQERIDRTVADMREDFRRDCPWFTDYLPILATSSRTDVDESEPTNVKGIAEELQRDLVNYIAQWVSHVGFHVVSELLRILRDELQQVVSVKSSAASEANPFGSARLNLMDISEQILEPLIEHCELATAVLHQEVSPASGSTSGRLFAQLADLELNEMTEGIAPHYKPRQGQMTLIDPDCFRAEFERLMKIDLAEFDKGNWANISRACCMQGVPLRNKGADTAAPALSSLIEIEQLWVPEDLPAGEAQPSRVQPLELRFPRRVHEIVERTRAWLQDPSSSFGRQYRMSIADYCNSGNVDEKMDRLKRFTSALNDIIQLSAPLVDMDNSSIVAFHQHSDLALTPTGRQVALTTVPFEGNSETGKACSDILTANGLDPSQVRFDGAAAEQDVFAFSTVKSGRQPMVFSSLIKPIADSWLSSSINPISRNGFWSGRRARPLADSIPLPPGIRLSMIVGWFIAIFFQQRTEQITDTNKGTKIDIWDPQFGWLGFPYPLLPKSPYDEYWLPSVLKSLGLAIVEAGVQGNERPLQAYWRLDDLGSEVIADPSVSKETWDGAPRSTMVRDWLNHGILPNGAPVPTRLDKDVEQSGGGRGDALLSRVRRNSESYLRLWEELWAENAMHTHGWSKAPELYEIRWDVHQALRVLEKYVETNGLDSPFSEIDS